MKIRWALLAVLCVLPLQASADTLFHVRINTPEARVVASELESAGFDVLEGSVTAKSLEVIASPRSLELLKQRGLDPVVLAQSRPFREIQLERRARMGLGDEVPPGYLNLAEINAELTAAATNFPAICKLVNVTQTYSAPQTFEGRDIFAVKISDNVNQDEDEPAFLLVGCHHAREIVTPELTLYAIEQLTTKYASDPRIKALVDEYEIWIAPVWNVDGYVYVFDVNNMWRKNRRVFAQGVGVDLNRNYPQGWNAPCSGSTNVSSDVYKGPSPASEAETQTMIALSEAEQFAKVLDYHSSGRESLYAYACSNHPFEDYFHDEAVLLSTQSGYGGDVRAPSAEGEHYEWQFAHFGSLAFLTETHTEFQPSHASAQAEAAKVWPGTLWLLERPIPLSGHVTDGVTQQPIEASIEYVGINFPNGEDNKSGGPFGRYRCSLPPGQYDVKFSAPGYAAQTHNVTITAGTAQTLDVQLLPPVLIMELIEGPSGLVAPGVAARVEVEIRAGTQTIKPGSEKVFYRYDAGTFQSIALTKIGGDRYEARLPSVVCDDTPEYYISAEGNLGTVITLPGGAPANVFTFEVGEIEELYHFNFESAPGWTVENLGATSGDWERGVPVNDPRWAYDPISDSDGSGQCWLTENSPGNTDVDNGATRLFSSSFDLSEGYIVISYDYYLYLTNTSGGVDRLLVEISSNGMSGPWTEIARHTSSGGLNWRSHEITQDDLNTAGVTMTADMVLRFTINDGNPQSIVESGLDALDISAITCGCLGDIDGDGKTDAQDLTLLLAAWFSRPGDPNWDPRADIDGDDFVGPQDLTLLLSDWFCGVD